MIDAITIVRAVRIARHRDRTVYDLHLSCGHVFTHDVFGPDRDNPMRGWRAMCWKCGYGNRQPDLFWSAEDIVPEPQE
jgi:hypothetical protein